MLDLLITQSNLIKMGKKTNPMEIDLSSEDNPNWYGGNDYDKPCRRSQSESISMLVYQKSYVIESNYRENLKLVTVTITTARPGIIIGRWTRGRQVKRRTQDIEKRSN
jgi:hypothetical protein